MAVDTRVSPALNFDIGERKTRRWVTIGVRPAKLDSSYAKPPKIKPNAGTGAWEEVNWDQLDAAQNWKRGRNKLETGTQQVFDSRPKTKRLPISDSGRRLALGRRSSTSLTPSLRRSIQLRELAGWEDVPTDQLEPDLYVVAVDEIEIPDLQPLTRQEFRKI